MRTGDPRYYVDPQVAILPIDALGFRRGAGALQSLLQGTGWQRTHSHAGQRRGIRSSARAKRKTRI